MWLEFPVVVVITRTAVVKLLEIYLEELGGISCCRNRGGFASTVRFLDNLGLPSNPGNGVC